MEYRACKLVAQVVVASCNTQRSSDVCAVPQVAQLATTTCATNFVLPVSGTICTTNAKDMKGVSKYQNCALSVACWWHEIIWR